MELWCVLVAAGQGSRLAEATDGVAKQFLPFCGEPLLLYAARRLAAIPKLRGMVIVLPVDGFAAHDAAIAACLQAQPLGIMVHTTPGGRQRQESVACGLASLPPTASHVLVHDAARPFVTAGLVNRLLDAWSADFGAVIPGLPVSDTIKACAGDRVMHTLDRACLMAIQTPQLFAVETLRRAHALAQTTATTATDDASLVEALGLPVRVVPGDPANRKLTHPEDLAMLKSPSPPRRPVVGFGYDVHAFGGHRPMVLGGIPIPGAPALRAHSDGDILLHALTDALLGCLGTGDIGDHFPDTDPRFAGIPSSVLLDQVLELGRQQGLTIDHVDLTLVAQTPRLTPHKAAIRANVARLLELDLRQVNLKATTEERLGFTGRNEGLKAMAAVIGSVPWSM